jgi:hypothetical protein
MEKGGIDLLLALGIFFGYTALSLLQLKPIGHS